MRYAHLAKYGMAAILLTLHSMAWLRSLRGKSTLQAYHMRTKRLCCSRLCAFCSRLRFAHWCSLHGYRTLAIEVQQIQLLKQSSDWQPQ